MFGKEPKLVMDYGPHGGTILERLIEITDKVPQLRVEAKRNIRKAQAELEKKLEGRSEVQFQKGDLVWYFNKPLSMRHDAKLSQKWKGPYQIVAVLDKGAYKVAIDGKKLKTTVNENLLKLYYDRST